RERASLGPCQRRCRRREGEENPVLWRPCEDGVRVDFALDIRLLISVPWFGCVKDLEATLERIGQTQPTAKSYKSSASMPKGLPTNATASRSLVLRPVLYIAIGIALLALGSKCITQNVDVSVWIMRLVDGAFERAHDF
ncbi:MAG: hypothetical protein IKF78_01905, partial [Atopobiaceae bacterium]|nr:hypothetical protein [Atopobiaceae bacterium]